MTPLLWALVVVVALWLLSSAALVLVLWWVSRRDPVDTHWLTAVAVLTPDHPDLPHAADCDCAECVYVKFAEIVAQLREEPTR